VDGGIDLGGEQAVEHRGRDVADVGGLAANVSAAYSRASIAGSGCPTKYTPRHTGISRLRRIRCLISSRETASATSSACVTTPRCTKRAITASASSTRGVD
jgi:hypothetical protein